MKLFQQDKFKSMQTIHHHFDTIHSTNTWAKENYSQFVPDAMTVITADAQTAGRGRFKRKWLSPANQNIYATFCFFLKAHTRYMGNIAQILAFSATEVLENLGLNPQLKWPNDILLSGKKVAGVLCETSVKEQRVCVIAGIGINVNMPEETLQQIDRPATSLMVETGKTFDQQELINQLEKQFLLNLNTLQTQGFLGFLERYSSKLGYSKGQKIKFQCGQILLEGSFSSIKNDGSLNLLFPSGEIRNFVAGEIV